MRCVFAVVDLDPAEYINKLRQRFDPLYGHVPAHVTIVFPFELPIATDDIARHLEAVFASHLAITLSFGPCHVEQQGYAYLPVETGADKLLRLYEQANSGILLPVRSQQRFSGPFLPHLTIGQVRSAANATLIASLAANLHHKLSGVIRSVCLETILPDNKSQVEFVVHLLDAD